MGTDEFHEACKAKLLEIARSRGTADADYEQRVSALRDDENIFVLGLIDSLSAVELVEFIEQIFGVEVLLDEHEPADFYTTTSMYDAFSGASRPTSRTPA